MFQAVKAKLSTLLSPGTTHREEVLHSSTLSRPSNRERKRRQPEEDLDSVLVNPGKRRRPSKSDHQRAWSLSRIFEYVIGNVKNTDKCPSVMQMSQMSSSSRENPYEDKHPERRVLTPVRRNTTRRTALTQISNSTVLDLTNIDDVSDDDVKVVKVSIDLLNCEPTTQTPQGRRPTTDDKSVKSMTPFMPPQSVRKSLKTIPICNNMFLTESFRLDEKKRYKELLAQFTTVSLPEYSESISPTTSPVTSPVAENIHTSPLFERQRVRKSIEIDLTRNLPSSVSHHRRKNFVDLTPSYQQSKIDVIDLEKDNGRTNSTASIDLTFSETDLERISFSKSSLEHNSILNTDWIKKWRDTLDPMQLERERRIKEEELKKEVIKKKQQEEFERLSKELESSANEFPELTDVMLGKIKKALGPGNSGDVFVQGFNAEVTRGDVSTLRDSTWLNDEVVNFYFNLVKARNEEGNNLPKVHVFNTFFYPKIMKTGHAGVKRWTRKIDIFSMDLILIPVHLGMHWCLAVIDFRNKEIVYYDSLKGNNSSCIQGLKKYLSDESMDKKKTSFDFTDWKELMPKQIPEQMNGCDCGVFMCKYAEYKSRYAKFTFTQDNMSYFRKRMIYEILSKKLL